MPTPWPHWRHCPVNHYPSVPSVSTSAHTQEGPPLHNHPHTSHARARTPRWPRRRLSPSSSPWLSPSRSTSRPTARPRPCASPWTWPSSRLSARLKRRLTLTAPTTACSSLRLSARRSRAGSRRTTRCSSTPLAKMCAVPFHRVPLIAGSSHLLLFVPAPRLSALPSFLPPPGNITRHPFVFMR